MEQPLAVNAENSRAKVQNVSADSSAVNWRILCQRRFPASSYTCADCGPIVRCPVDFYAASLSYDRPHPAFGVRVQIAGSLLAIEVDERLPS